MRLWVFLHSSAHSIKLAVLHQKSHFKNIIFKYIFWTNIESMSLQNTLQRDPVTS